MKGRRSQRLSGQGSVHHNFEDPPPLRKPSRKKRPPTRSSEVRLTGQDQILDEGSHPPKTVKRTISSVATDSPNPSFESRARPSSREGIKRKIFSEKTQILSKFRRISDQRSDETDEFLTPEDDLDNLDVQMSGSDVEDIEKVKGPFEDEFDEVDSFSSDMSQENSPLTPQQQRHTKKSTKTPEGFEPQATKFFASGDSLSFDSPHTDSENHTPSPPPLDQQFIPKIVADEIDDLSDDDDFDTLELSQDRKETTPTTKPLNRTPQQMYHLSSTPSSTPGDQRFFRSSQKPQAKGHIKVDGNSLPSRPYMDDCLATCTPNTVTKLTEEKIHEEFDSLDGMDDIQSDDDEIVFSESKIDEVDQFSPRDHVGEFVGESPPEIEENTNQIRGNRFPHQFSGIMNLSSFEGNSLQSPSSSLSPFNMKPSRIILNPDVEQTPTTQSNILPTSMEIDDLSDDSPLRKEDEGLPSFPHDSIDDSIHDSIESNESQSDSEPHTPSMPTPKTPHEEKNLGVINIQNTSFLQLKTYSTPTQTQKSDLEFHGSFSGNRKRQREYSEGSLFGQMENGVRKHRQLVTHSSHSMASNSSQKRRREKREPGPKKYYCVVQSVELTELLFVVKGFLTDPSFREEDEQAIFVMKRKSGTMIFPGSLCSLLSWYQIQTKESQKIIFCHERSICGSRTSPLSPLSPSLSCESPSTREISSVKQSNSPALLPNQGWSCFATLASQFQKSLVPDTQLPNQRKLLKGKDELDEEAPQKKGGKKGEVSDMALQIHRVVQHFDTISLYNPTNIQCTVTRVFPHPCLVRNKSPPTKRSAQCAFHFSLFGSIVVLQDQAGSLGILLIPLDDSADWLELLWEGEGHFLTLEHVYLQRKAFISKGTPLYSFLEMLWTQKGNIEKSHETATFFLFVPNALSRYSIEKKSEESRNWLIRPLDEILEGPATQSQQRSQQPSRKVGFWRVSFYATITDPFCPRNTYFDVNSSRVVNQGHVDVLNLESRVRVRIDGSRDWHDFEFLFVPGNCVLFRDIMVPREVSVDDCSCPEVWADQFSTFQIASEDERLE